MRKRRLPGSDAIESARFPIDPTAVRFLKAAFVRVDDRCGKNEAGNEIMNANFFEWIRQGVRQSVLLGVGDAIEQIGTPEDVNNLHPDVAALLQVDTTPETKSTRARGGNSSGGRKRLGKSLKDMNPGDTKKS